MSRRPYLSYTGKLRDEIWDRYQRGESLTSIGRSVNPPVLVPT